MFGRLIEELVYGRNVQFLAGKQQQALKILKKRNSKVQLREVWLELFKIVEKKDCKAEEIVSASR